jgi:arylsulfatase A
LPLAAVTSGERFKAEGYRTGYFGKWHLGGNGFGPTDQGFDVAKGTGSGGATNTYFAPYSKAFDDLKPAPAGESLIDRLTDEAIAFIKASDGQPFFVQLSHYAPHIPLQARPEVVAKYKQGKPGEQGNPKYAAMLEGIDDSFGRLLKTLDDQKLADSTVVVFTSDHGGVATLEGGLKEPPTFNGPYREGKGHLYEGGLRVPLIVRVPGVEPAVSNAQADGIDLVPTLCDLSGIPTNPKDFDGVSLVPALKGREMPQRPVFHYYPHYANQHNKPGMAVRRGDWKLFVDAETGREELYNLKGDVGERKNVQPENPSIARDLHAELDAWAKSMGVAMPPPNPGYNPNPPNNTGVITMTAELAVVHGTQLRFEPLPHKWCLGYWTRLEDTASFDFTAATPGKYEVVMLLGCGKGSGGSKVQVSVGDEKLTFTVPETGGFQKFESKVVGTVTVAKAGRHTLTVTPLTKPGPAVMDLREVVLRPAK